MPCEIPTIMKVRNRIEIISRDHIVDQFVKNKCFNDLSQLHPTSHL